MKPLCFVLMPFGDKRDAGGRLIRFDEIYNQLLAAAIAAADMEPLRADEEITGGIIHKPMFERLVLCEYAMADLTTANANVFYELGIRHAVRPWSTVLVFNKTTRLPFDVAPLRGFPYQVDDSGSPSAIMETVEALKKRLVSARDAAHDSPLFQLLDGIQAPDVSHLKTDVFRERVEYSKRRKEQLRVARTGGRDAVYAVERDLGEIAQADAAVVIDLFLSYRAVKAWEEMVSLVEKMSKPLAGTIMVQEQLAFALNRLGQSERAEEILNELLSSRGSSSETYGLLGRVFKDRWQHAFLSGDAVLAQGSLRKCIEAYVSGFNADLRDTFPGINAVTMMEMSEPADPRQQDLLPVVKYAAKQRLRSATVNYWDYAVMLELAILGRDEQGARTFLADCIGAIRERWEPETTARNVRLIREARERRGEQVIWIHEIERALQARTGSP